MDKEFKNKIIKEDAKLSQRHINLDPEGYFIIKIDHKIKAIIVEHYLNNINQEGYAIDPKTRKQIKCDSNIKRRQNVIFRGESAKELGILITEKRSDLISKYEHALYLGRELQKAEQCLIDNSTYIQD
mgnify:FL=1|tara:strand:- start:57 stop:440 length:384 start_codon:yes stop_codon:yes gene_type:complete